MRNPKEEKEKKGKLKNPREHQLEASWAAGARRRLKATDGWKMRRGGGGGAERQEELGEGHSPRSSR